MNQLNSAPSLNQLNSGPSLNQLNSAPSLKIAQSSLTLSSQNAEPLAFHNIEFQNSPFTRLSLKNGIKSPITPSVDYLDLLLDQFVHIENSNVKANQIPRPLTPPDEEDDFDRQFDEAFEEVFNSNVE